MLHTIGMVDASVVAIAERLKIDTLATPDRGHFSPWCGRRTSSR
jgi:predicted nucleic acid-binding protein